jgi:penicillin-binding protein 2
MGRGIRCGSRLERVLRTSDFDPISVEIFHKQLRRTTVLVLLAFAVLILRMWFLQIVNGSIYRTKSESNRFQLQDIPPFRGVIYDRNGEILVGNRPSYDLLVIPESVQDRPALLRSLKALLDLDPVEVEKRLGEASPLYPFKSVCLKRDMSRDELAVIETHRFNLPGVIIRVKPQRHYIYDSLGSHLFGYLGEIDENQLREGLYRENKQGDLVGKSGVELRWQRYLNGKRGGEQVEVDAAGRNIRVISRRPPRPGVSLYLTVDKGIQQLAEKLLSGKKGAVAAMDPRNGKILALASSPPFNPNLFIGGIDAVTWREIATSEDYPLQNRSLAGQYPPGSVFKIIVALAGLEEGVIDPEEEVFCNGVYKLGRRQYRCWKKHGHGKVNLHRALRESCDVYFYRAGKRLGIDRISDYAKRFGLGRRSGIDVGQEKGGLVPTREWKLKKYGVPWQGGETISLSIGQSFLLVTPIQMAGMMAAVFNGGVLYRPQVTARVGELQLDRIYEFRPEIAGSLGINHEHLERVRKALVGVVNEPHGTGWRARLKEVTVAGKTGTAQVVALEREKMLNQKGELPPEFRDHAWFVAAAPAERPKIVLAVLVENGGHGGSAAAPMAKAMIKKYLGVKK